MSVGDESRRIGRRALFGRLLPQAPEKGGRWVKVHRTALACRFEVTLPSEDARHVEAARAALDEVGAIEDSLTWSRDTSEVSRINRGAAGAPVAVGPSLFALLSLCRELHAATGGAFDPASAALFALLGVPRPAAPRAGGRGDRGGPRPLGPRQGGGGRPRAHGALHGARRRARLGAVGKGWALDRVAATLRVRGVFRALLTAGGASHRGWGGEAWELALRPGGEDLGLLRLRGAALGTSAAGDGASSTPARAGRRKGCAARVSWRREAAVADALSAAFLVGGPELAGLLLRVAPGDDGAPRHGGASTPESWSSGSATASRSSPRPASA